MSRNLSITNAIIITAAILIHTFWALSSMLVIGKLWFTHNMSHAEIEFQITSTASLICFQLVVMVGFANINYMYLYHKRIITVLWSCKTIWGRNIYMLHTHISQRVFIYLACWLLNIIRWRCRRPYRALQQHKREIIHYARSSELSTTW